MGEDWYFLTVLGVLMALISFTMSFAVGRVVRGNPPTPTHPPAQEPGLQARSLDAGEAGAGSRQVQRGQGGHWVWSWHAG